MPFLCLLPPVAAYAEPEPRAADASWRNSAYVAATVGNGAAYGKEVAGDRTMKWRPFEVRFGTEVDPSALYGGQAFSADRRLRFDIVHYNEGIYLVSR